MLARAVLLAAVVLVAGCLGAPAEPEGQAPAGTTPPPASTPGSTTPTPAEPVPGPSWSFTDTEGASHSRDAPASNATVLFFMATWCSTCRATAPALAEVHTEYADRGVRSYTVSFDPTESDADLRAWKERYQQPWPHGVDDGLAMQKAFKVRSQSTVIVLDGSGNVVKHFGFGQASARNLREALDATLAPA